MAEHRGGMKNMGTKKGIAIHVQKTAHTINWQEARILAREDNWGRRVLKAFEIQQRPMMKLHAGLILDPS